MENKTTTAKSNPLIPALLTPKEKEAIDYFRSLGFGRLYLVVKNGEPIRAEEPIKTKEF